MQQVILGGSYWAGERNNAKRKPAHQEVGQLVAAAPEAAVRLKTYEKPLAKDGQKLQDSTY